MPTKEDAQLYMNLLSRCLKIVDEFPGAFNEINSILHYEEVADEIFNLMDTLWKQGIQAFLFHVAHLLNEIENHEDESVKFVKAFETCKWMDMRITYLLQHDAATEFSLWSLIPMCRDKYVKTGALNTNYEDTGIWINPKFEILSTYTLIDGEEKQKRIANRDIFENANGHLLHCSYIRWDGKHEVINVIIPNDSIIEKNKDILRIAFSPLSDNKKLLETENISIVRNGIEKAGINVKCVGDAEILRERICNDWMLACDCEADILFMPELIGTEDSERSSNGYNETILRLSMEALAEGKATPCITALPSYWNEGENRVSILYQDGKILETQEKHVPYVDEKNHVVEALKETVPWKTVLLHIPYIHRIAIEICAEFLANQSEHVYEFICGELGATLILVPSYSRGEQDFINVLSGLKSYGATVIWGNCCGAIRSEEKGIGGCGLAGTQDAIVFGDCCECGNSCDDIKACLFQIDIPLKYEVKKVGNRKDIIIVRHIIKQKKMESRDEYER